MADCPEVTDVASPAEADPLPPLTPEERQRLHDALERARHICAHLLAARGGAFPSSGKLVDDMRADAQRDTA